MLHLFPNAVHGEDLWPWEPKQIQGFFLNKELWLFGGKPCHECYIRTLHPVEVAFTKGWNFSWNRCFPSPWEMRHDRRFKPLVFGWIGDLKGQLKSCWIKQSSYSRLFENFTTRMAKGWLNKDLNTWELPYPLHFFETNTTSLSLRPRCIIIIPNAQNLQASPE